MLHHTHKQGHSNLEDEVQSTGYIQRRNNLILNLIHLKSVTRFIFRLKVISLNLHFAMSAEAGNRLVFIFLFDLIQFNFCIEHIL